MRVNRLLFNNAIYFYFSSSPKNLHQYLVVTSLWMISTLSLALETKRLQSMKLSTEKYNGDILLAVEQGQNCL